MHSPAELNVFEKVALDVLKKNAAGIKITPGNSSTIIEFRSVFQANQQAHEMCQAMEIMSDRHQGLEIHPNQYVRAITKDDAQALNDFMTELADLGVNYPGASQHLSKTVG